MYYGLAKGNADAVLAASIFHFGTYRIAQVKQYLMDHGVPVRQHHLVPVPSDG
jgi:cyclase